MATDRPINIAVIGGAGVRTPLLVRQLGERPQLARRTTLRLMDVDGGRLDLMMRVVRALAPGVRALTTQSIDEALQGADFVLLTIRVGGEEARALDERIALEHGCLGQETTGPGGMAMALRTIPVVMSYFERCQEICPHAWILNLTNPSGIITQALVEAGATRVLGLCDAPDALAEDLAGRAGVSSHSVDWDYFGLNHLGWMLGALHDGQDILSAIIDQASVEGWGKRGVTLFPGPLVRALGAIPNEYCYFYYFARQAVANMGMGQTRGERIRDLGRALFSDLGRDCDPLLAYTEYLARRRGTYLRAETGTLASYEHDSALEQALRGGYGGIALDTIEALSGGGKRTLIVNTPNNGRVPYLEDGDVIEGPVDLSTDSAIPRPVGKPFSDMRGLVSVVKSYERLVLAAARNRCPGTALRALMAHPLVPGYPEAALILSDYRRQLADWLPGWENG